MGQGRLRCDALDGLGPSRPTSASGVIDVANFSPKTDFQGSRENLHLVERWTRTGPTSLEYVVTLDDPAVWTRSWTVAQEFTKQSDEENRLYYQPRCIEGNYALPGLSRGARLEELAFVEGRGPDSATRDSATATVEASIGGKWLELLSEVALGLERAAIVLNPDSGPYSAVMPSLTAVPG